MELSIDDPWVELSVVRPLGAAYSINSNWVPSISLLAEFEGSACKELIMTIVLIARGGHLAISVHALFLLVFLPAAALGQSLKSSTPGTIADGSSASTTVGTPVAQPATAEPPAMDLALAANPRALSGRVLLGAVAESLGVEPGFSHQVRRCSRSRRQLARFRRAQATFDNGGFRSRSRHRCRCGKASAHSRRRV